METSRDWANELVETLKWLGIAFVITAVVFVAVVALLMRFTRWGRQYWRLTGGFFTGRENLVTNLLFVGFLLFSTIAAVRISVLLSYWSVDMFDSFQAGASALGSDDSDALSVAKAAFWSSMVVFSVLATIHVLRALIDYAVGQAFEIRWRIWLTDHVTTDWLKGQAYYRARFIDNTIDNPDQRIQADITDLVAQSRSLALGAVSSIVSIVSFTKILWDLSGPLNVFGTEIPRGMVFAILIYVLITTSIAFWIGHPLIWLNFRYERATANFRYALVRLRVSAENVAFYHGEGVERRDLLSRFANVIKVYWALVIRTLKFSGWNLGVSQAAIVFPYLLQGPRFFAGEVTLGGLQQTARAFGAIHDSLSFFREAYAQFASFRASLIRLDGLLVAADESRDLPKLTVNPVDVGTELIGVDVRKPDDTVLIDDLSLRLEPGDALVVKGRSGSGKTTLLRALAQMWPYADGEARKPEGDQTLFLSQIPYLPLGDLRTAVAYPAEPESISDDQLRETLTKVNLGHLTERLDEEADWSAILSPGEQQRLAFARILLIRPKVVFLDEATSAVDEGLEYALYHLVRTEVPDTILVSVAHRSTVDQHHTQRLELDGDGSWNLAPLNA